MNNLLSITSKATDQIKKIMSSAPEGMDSVVIKIDKSGCLDIKIIENFMIDDEDVDFSNNEYENTLSLLNKYIEDAEFDLDKDVVKNIMKEVYMEACQFQ